MTTKLKEVLIAALIIGLSGLAITAGLIAGVVFIVKAIWTS